MQKLITHKTCRTDTLANQSHPSIRLELVHQGCLLTSDPPWVTPAQMSSANSASVDGRYPGSLAKSRSTSSRMLLAIGVLCGVLLSAQQLLSTCSEVSSDTRDRLYNRLMTSGLNDTPCSRDRTSARPGCKQQSWQKPDQEGLAATPEQAEPGILHETNALNPGQVQQVCKICGR